MSKVIISMAITTGKTIAMKTIVGTKAIGGIVTWRIPTMKIIHIGNGARRKISQNMAIISIRKK